MLTQDVFTEKDLKELPENGQAQETQKWINVDLNISPKEHIGYTMSLTKKILRKTRMVRSPLWPLCRKTNG